MEKKEMQERVKKIIEEEKALGFLETPSSFLSWRGELLSSLLLLCVGGVIMFFAFDDLKVFDDKMDILGVILAVLMMIGGGIHLALTRVKRHVGCLIKEIKKEVSGSQGDEINPVILVSPECPDAMPEKAGSFGTVLLG